MGAQVLAVPPQDERRIGRVAFDAAFDCEYEDGERGSASWRSVSPDGACIRTGRYLRPGRQLRVRFHGLDLNLRVVWCRPTETGDRFVAGVHLLNGGPELALMTLTAVLQRLQLQAGFNH